MKKKKKRKKKSYLYFYALYFMFIYKTYYQISILSRVYLELQLLHKFTPFLSQNLILTSEMIKLRDCVTF